MTLLLVQRHAFVHHGIPWMAKKSVEMGRYGASELMRNIYLQKKAVNYDINELTPLIQDSVGKQEQPATKEHTFLVSQNCFIYHYHYYCFKLCFHELEQIRLPQRKNGLRAGKTFRLTIQKLQPKGSAFVWNRFLQHIMNAGR